MARINRNYRKILVFCPNWVGDVVMATPAFECLRQNFPEARMIAVIRRYAEGVIGDSPWFDQIIECHDKSLQGFIRMMRAIRRLKPDLAVVLPNSFRSALLARLGGAGQICGYRRNGRMMLLSGGPIPMRVRKEWLPIPMTQYYLEICRWLKFKIPEAPRPRLFFSDTLHAQSEKLLKQYGITSNDMVIGLNPGAQFGSSKCWPPDYFASLANMITEKWQCKLLLFVGPGEAQIAQSITSLSHAAIINTGPDNVDLSLLKPLIQRCQLLITNDTGPRHYAVAFDVPVVVIMGPTDPRYTDENLDKTLILRRQLDCSPCHGKTCPLDHECMTGITPRDVLQGSQKLLEKFS
jgi:heptosyltransferase-2